MTPPPDSKAELGFLLAYRSGWNLGVAALYSNAATALVLLPVAGCAG